MDRSTYLTELHGRLGLPRAMVVDLARRATGREATRTQRLVRGDEYEVHRVEIAGGGVVYPRICFPDAPPAKAHREAWVMERARAADVPAPEVLAVETLATDDGDRQAMVVSEAPGRQLSVLRPALSVEDRSVVMRDLGRVLGRLHTVRLPGFGHPDEHGDWPDPEEHHRRYLGNVIADSGHLDRVGFTSAEIEEIGRLLRHEVVVSPDGRPTLCHTDISVEHVFVDDDLRVTGLIDWGLWLGGAPADELAALSMRLDEDDFVAVMAGYPGGSLADVAFGRAVSRSVLTQAIGHIRWLIRSGQSDGIEPLATAARRGIAELSAAA